MSLCRMVHRAPAEVQLPGLDGLARGQLVQTSTTTMELFLAVPIACSAVSFLLYVVFNDDDGEFS